MDITQLTLEIDQLKKDMDEHPKNSGEYADIKAKRDALMRKRLKMRKENSDTVSISSSNSRKSVKIIEPRDARSEGSQRSTDDDEYLETMKYIAEQEKLYQESLQHVAEGPSTFIDPSGEAQPPAQIIDQPPVQEPQQRPTQEEAIKLANEFVSDLRRMIPDKVSFAEQPVNDAITRQFAGPKAIIPKETLIGDIYKLQAVMGIHPTEDLKELSYEDLQMKLKEVSAKFKSKKHTVSELLANLHVVGLTALLNLSNPICEDQAGFSFADVQKNAEDAKPMLISCYDDLIQEDPVLGKYLMSASSGAVGLLSASTVIAAKSFTTDQKKFSSPITHSNHH